LYPYLRFVTAAALIAFALVIGAGMLALLPAALEPPLVASAGGSDAPAIACKQHWLNFDRNCLSRRGMPWMAGHRESNAVEVPFAGESTPEQSFAESQQTAPPPEKSARNDIPPELLRGDLAMPEQATLMPPAAAAEPPAAKPVIEAEAGPRVAKPADEARARLPYAKRAGEAQPHLSAPKTAARRVRSAKQPTNEALTAVRKFGDHLRDIPVSAYSADGTRREIVIRPTSIQDVYYYSAPR
jgi:hypothetical protein